MSSGGTTTNSPCNGSPRHHGFTTQRRRVADFMDAEKGLDCYIINGVNDHDDDLDSNNGGTHGSVYHHHLHHHLNPLVRYLPLLRKGGSCVPQRVMRMEDSALRACAVSQCLVSGKNVGRKLFGALMMMVVVSVFVKVSFMVGPNVEVVSGKRRENGLIVLQTFKDDSAMAQRVVTDVEASSGAVMPKRLLEKFPQPNRGFRHFVDAHAP
ncbi:hypothetical protein U1Q18_008516 [Sarracenia purpurea var. burkii]